MNFAFVKQGLVRNSFDIIWITYNSGLFDYKHVWPATKATFKRSHFLVVMSEIYVVDYI